MSYMFGFGSGQLLYGPLADRFGRRPVLLLTLAGVVCAAIHGDEVEMPPAGATLLAGNGVTHVQAAEIRYDKGVFWGVQYHPELALGEIALA